MAIDENLILTLVRRKVVTDTFRRLRPDKKERVYTIALRLFGEYGYDGLAVDRFCKEAGLSKGSFFQYFPTKTHLLELTILVFESTFRELFASVKAHDRGGRTKDRLRFAVRAMVDLSRSHPDEWRFYHFVTLALAHSRVEVAGVQIDTILRDYVSEILKEGQTRREIRTDIDVPLTASAIVLLAKEIIDTKSDSGSSRAQEEQIIGLVLDGISSR